MSKRLIVTFSIDASQYSNINGVSATAFAQQDAYDMFFKRAEGDVLASMMRAAMYPSHNKNSNDLLKIHLEHELKIIKDAAKSATYEIVDEKEF